MNVQVNGVCPEGMGLCSQQGFAASVTAEGKPGGISGGNSQSIFPAFPADAVGTNSSLAGVAAATVIDAKSWGQGNSFSKIFSAAARVVAPGLLNATDVFKYWTETMESTQQPNGSKFTTILQDARVFVVQQDWSSSLPGFKILTIRADFKYLTILCTLDTRRWWFNACSTFESVLGL